MRTKMEANSCPLCSGDSDHVMTMPIDAKTFKPIKHGQVYQCRTCGFKFVFPRPDSTDEFYQLEAYYTKGLSHLVERDETRLSTRIRVHLAWRVDRSEALPDVISAELPNNGAIVDVGCGSGALIRELQNRGYAMTGIERDIESLSLLQLNVIEGTAEDLSNVPKHSFDGVVFSHVVEHLVDPVKALRDAADLLKTGGKLFCEVPNNESTIARQSRLSWEHLDIPRHLNFFDERSLLRLAGKNRIWRHEDLFFGIREIFLRDLHRNRAANS